MSVKNLLQFCFSVLFLIHVSDSRMLQESTSHLLSDPKLSLDFQQPSESSFTEAPSISTTLAQSNPGVMAATSLKIVEAESNAQSPIYSIDSPHSVLTANTDGFQTELIPRQLSTPYVTWIPLADGEVLETTITPSSPTTRLTTKTSTAGSLTATPSSPCPDSLARDYVSRGGGRWQLFCLAIFNYFDLPAESTTTFADCLEKCEKYTGQSPYNQPCIAVTWTGELAAEGSNCLLKFSVQQVTYGQKRYCSAKKLSYQPPDGLAVSVVESFAAGINLPIATVSLDYTAISPEETRQPWTPQPCPLPENSEYTPPDGSGTTYRIMCGISLFFNDLPPIDVATFEDCMAACNAWRPNPVGQLYDQPCVAITFIALNSDEPSCKRHFATSRNFQVTDIPFGHSAIRMDQAISYNAGSGVLYPNGPLGPSRQKKAHLKTKLDYAHPALHTDSSPASWLDHTSSQTAAPIASTFSPYFSELQGKGEPHGHLRRHTNI